MVWDSELEVSGLWLQMSEVRGAGFWNAAFLVRAALVLEVVGVSHPQVRRTRLRLFPSGVETAGQAAWDHFWGVWVEVEGLSGAGGR